MTFFITLIREWGMGNREHKQKKKQLIKSGLTKNYYLLLPIV